MGGIMAQDIKIVSVSIPTELVKELDRICDREHCNRSELYRDALRQYLKLRRWQALREYTTAKAVDREFEVENIISEISS
jgi:metal-responsive CopG/Arc/MetJ family transcriptional regulator